MHFYIFSVQSYIIYECYGNLYAEIFKKIP